MSRRTPAKLEVRTAKPGDIPGILALIGRVYAVYSGVENYTPGMIRGQINNFPDGQFVALYEGQVVGYCASSRIDEHVALAPHDWEGITGNGFGSRHDPTGDWLYGFELAVDKNQRGLRIGKRLYEARRALAERLELKGIVFAGRMPNYRRNRAKVDGPADYVEQVREGKIKDPVIGFQLSNGFEPIGILENYLPEDKQSMAFAAHMVWRNPYVDPNEPPTHRVPRDIESVRLATCQLQARAVKNFDEFIHNVEYFIDVASSYECDFIVFPELFTLSLLSFEKKKLSPAEAIDRLTEWRQPLVEQLSHLALSYNINIVGGSHPTRTDDGDIQNVAYVCLRDGSVHAQEKLHPTPNEAYWWKIKGGDSVDVIQTDIGPVGVLICYDSEFPELARKLVDEGARIIFVPFCTDNRQGYMRVRYCAQARAVENQCFVVMSGNVGNLPGVENMDIQYAQSAILTPCDFPFARDGIAAEASENIEALTIADVNLADLTWARAEGTVRNLTDRRFDLYRIDWTSGPRAEEQLMPTRAPMEGKGPGGG
ncbi:bifunctional GNAT family N-acetyltransferase/carbon-nitrogen hydrolase family protein [Stakelama sediminis]|uniref:Putative amidohydrolase/putative N-acetyltransferase YhbS n=1 Tax=Stakelama sediminis TaxID=463200 RepID=A0A840Z105_9SPHN|nr:bifunctional GNAT family N-acetyltransferase/carbon-nitrogen hydrolase family protein [Stakelama sediminis]MBB5719459.1 putative amidohydrolase/putative N-acetyltransferase YhbS [Stakelama sediminis]